MMRLPVLPQWVRWACTAACAAALVGCAVPEWQKPGTPATQIAQDMGTPHVRSALPEGGQRWIYSRQPMGQEVFQFDFDSAQRLVSVRQVLQATDFYQLQVGVDTQDVVYRYFGAPALVERVGNFKGDIWTYRMRENGGDRQAHVFLDPQKVVQRVMFTDELRNDDQRD